MTINTQKEAFAVLKKIKHACSMELAKTRKRDWIFASISFLLFMAAVINEQDMLANIASEGIGLTVTIVVIDRMLEQQRKNETYNERYSAYEFSRSMLARAVATWTDVISRGLPANKKAPDFVFELESLRGIENSLNLEAPYGDLKIISYIKYSIDDMRSDINLYICSLSKHGDSRMTREMIALRRNYVTTFMDAYESIKSAAPDYTIWRLEAELVHQHFISPLLKIEEILNEIAQEFRNEDGFIEPPTASKQKPTEAILGEATLGQVRCITPPPQSSRRNPPDGDDGAS